jgi:hypothetical protein
VVSDSGNMEIFKNKKLSSNMRLFGKAKEQTVSVQQAIDKLNEQIDVYEKRARHTQARINNELKNAHNQLKSGNKQGISKMFHLTHLDSPLPPPSSSPSSSLTIPIV